VAQQLYQHYYEPLAAVLDAADLRKVFTVLCEIRDCQRQLHATLEGLGTDMLRTEELLAREVLAGDTARGIPRSTSTRVGQAGPFAAALEQFVPFFRMYQPYIAGFPEAQAKLLEVQLAIGGTII
jgi:hypothetical protein